MHITKCDICKKQIKEEPIIVGANYWEKKELCEKCGAPILRFLKKHKLIKRKIK